MVLTGSLVRLVGFFLFLFLLADRSCEDAIDNITTKVDLLKYCHENNIKASAWYSFHIVNSLFNFPGLFLYGIRRKM
jgi:hypothetical protein